MDNSIRSISEIISEIPLNLITSLDKKDKSYIFDTQVNAAKDIVISLLSDKERSNHVILIAKMQSGKTGTCNAISNLVMNTPLKDIMGVNRIMYISGMNDCGLANQTYNRILEQVTKANTNNTVDRLKKRLPTLEEPLFYVLKNSTLNTYKGDIKGSLIFIDESHYGSKELNILTSFMTKKGIDWKNKKILEQNNIYIVSVSATPFDEVVSDVLDCKPIVELKTDGNYFGVSEYFENGFIYPATKRDLDTGDINKYIEDAYNRMAFNHEKGIVIVRSRDFDYFHNNAFIQKHFDIVELDSSNSKIEYGIIEKYAEKLINDNNKVNKIDLSLKNSHLPVVYDESKIKNITKPLLILIKGAFRAGITIKPKIKDLIYMVYDYSEDANATAQALLGRMCGYRDTEHASFNTMIYVNEKFAKMYAQWEKNFSNKTLIPSSRTKWVWVGNDYTGNDVKLGVKSCGNFTIQLTNEEILNICRLSLTSERKNHKKIERLIESILSNHNKNIDYLYMFDHYLKGKNNYKETTQDMIFNKFSSDSIIMQFRAGHSKKFSEDTGRTELNKSDLGKKAISVVFDGTIQFSNGRMIVGGNKRLLVYYYEVAQKKQMANHETLYYQHKDTSKV